MHVKKILLLMFFGTLSLLAVPPSTSHGKTYNIQAQDVAIGQAITFDRNDHVFNFFHTLGSSDITINTDGIYRISFYVTAAQKNQFAIFVNGVVVPESITGSAKANKQTRGTAFVPLERGDVVTIVNYTSPGTVHLKAHNGGKVESENASVIIQWVQFFEC